MSGFEWILSIPLKFSSISILSWFPVEVLEGPVIVVVVVLADNTNEKGVVGRLLPTVEDIEKPSMLVLLAMSKVIIHR
jgi:hypothetical protein